MADLHAPAGPKTVKGFFDLRQALALDAFVQQAERGGGQGRVLRIPCTACGEADEHVEHRQFRRLDKQHLGSCHGFPGLDLQRAGDGWRRRRLGQ
ncbi:hypothetical protein D3C81_2105640 [compost metagenome]